MVALPDANFALHRALIVLNEIQIQNPAKRNYANLG